MSLLSLFILFELGLLAFIYLLMFVVFNKTVIKPNKPDKNSK